MFSTAGRFHAAAAGLLVAAALAGTTPSYAQFADTYVSSYGDDTNSCSYPVVTGSTPANFGPCRSFNGALGKTRDGGRIICIDQNSYDFQQPTITKSVTIDCQHGMNVSNMTFFKINAPGKTVRLRSLGFSSLGDNYPLIEIIAAGSVQFENISVFGSNANGILDRRTGPGRLAIKDTTVMGNSGPGIVIAPQGGTTISAVLDNVTVQDSNYGIAVGSGGRVMVKRSVFSGNFTAGIAADPGAVISVDSTLIASNATGVRASPGSAITLKNSSIDSNNIAISGATQSYGDNGLTANVSNGTAPTPINPF